ncbi:ABC transporter ATP-binding protein [Limibaculum sp. M0105]|uniref:ABC transporter ATP-binding protein n=1 Tax=Thermohalobaculum xanthum TaxID=2753746 RepID=A0A8J7M7S3_9RHOB|nr:ABC transporter ATP-binding protein [Thermohalobaculum xanthum]MBK0399457.1 ABC transporter ATP-binding protein [Thermohalobaculum xanthum]
MTDDVLIVEGLGKSHGPVTALADVDLRLAAGQRLALLGHNGAGKTTLIKLALGLIAPSAGRITVAGARPGSRAARAATAYLPEAVAFHASLTGREQLALFARLAGEPARAAGPLLERVGLAHAADRRIRTWSKGMRQRLGIAQAMLGRPRLALLDEPASGLDPVSRHDLYALIDEMAQEGTAVLIASHALTEVEARTDRIAILSGGRLVANDTLGGLRARAAMPIRLRLVARDGAAEEVQARLGGRRVNGASVEILCAPQEKMDTLGRIAALGPLVADLEVTPPGLEALYRHYSGEEKP